MNPRKEYAEAVESRSRFEAELIIALERKGMSRWYTWGRSSRLFDILRIKKRRF